MKQVVNLDAEGDTMKKKVTCPDHPRANTNDFGGSHVLCAMCSRQILKVQFDAMVWR